MTPAPPPPHPATGRRVGHHLRRADGRIVSLEPPPRPLPREERLVLAVAERDHAAFADVYDTFSPVVYGLVRRVVRDLDLAADVTQEVFLEIWRRASQFDPSRGSARSWVLVIAHRRAVDRVRAEQAGRDRLQRAGRDVERPAAGPDEDVPALLDLELDRVRVQRALDQLSGPQRQAIELAFFGGFTHTEVAAYLGVPLGTIKTRIRDGLLRLRTVLGEAA